jgi:transcriptional regulator with GAF, ATPase, and Fis domain
MKTIAGCFSTDTHDGGHGFPNECCPEFAERYGQLQSLEGTVEFDTFRPILMDLDRGTNDDDLVLRLRTQAARLLPCDRVCIAFCGDGLYQIFEKADGHQSTLIAAGARTSLWSAREARLIPENMIDPLRYSSGVQAPFRIKGKFAGTISFLARKPQLFHESDMLLAQRIADSVGLIFGKARNLEPESNFDLSPEDEWKDPLLRAICEVPDIHRILPQLSEIVGAAIPHDRLTISYHDRDRYMSMRSVSNDDGPTFDRVWVSSNDFPPDGTSLIINDLVSHRPMMEPYDFHDKAVSAGYRSFLVTHVWGGRHGLGFVFWSKQADAFHRSDVPSAAKIAELCTVAVSRERLAPEISLAEMPATNIGAPLRNSRDGFQRAGAIETRADSAERPRQRSSAWNAVIQTATQVAASDTTVLLVGETGTGKEVIARLIYNESARKNGPFVAVNCAAVPDTLLESELFGFERGAFTGAYHHKRGYIELASRGVLFLDELSELSLGAQAKLLRVLETREFQSLGGARPQKADIRVIGATNKNLREEVRAGRFRADLYYRLCVFEISLPPLRSRSEDILPLAYTFIGEVKGGAGQRAVEISPQAEHALVQYDWPGNVRELRNVIERALILAHDGIIDVEHLAFLKTDDVHVALGEISAVERSMIERAMQECGGNKARAARMLGLSRTQLYVRLRRYALAVVA